MDGEREKFEEWNNARGNSTEKAISGEYEHPKTRAMWMAWQARASLPSAQPSDVVKYNIELGAAIHALIGFTSLPVNQIITQGWLDRLNDYYVKNVLAALSTTQQAQSVQPTDCEYCLYNKLRDTCIKTGVSLDVLRKPIHPDVQKLVEAANGARIVVQGAIAASVAYSGETDFADELRGKLKAIDEALAPFTANKE